MLTKSSIAVVASRKLRKKIGSGELGANGVLPPIRKLADELNFSVPTLLDSIRILERQGIVRRRQGSGVYVNPLDKRHLEITLLQLDYPTPRRELFSKVVSKLCKKMQFHFAERVVPLEPMDYTGLPDFSDVIIYHAPANPLNPHWLAEVLNRCQLLVILDRQVSSLAVDSISIDGENMARKAIEHLAQLGHRNIAYLHLCPDCYEVMIRYSAAAARSAELGILLRKIDCGTQPGDDGKLLAKKALHREFSSGIPDFTAILAEAYPGALAALEVCRECNISVPDQMSIIGLNDESGQKPTDPSLTLVVEREDGFAKALEEIIDRRIYQNEEEHLHLLVPGELIARETTGTPKRG